MAGTLAVWTVLGIFALIIASFIWKSRFGLFTTGFVQVFLVAVNTYLISKEKYIAVFFVEDSFLLYGHGTSKRSRSELCEIESHMRPAQVSDL